MHALRVRRTQRALPLVGPTCINTPRAERKLNARAARPFRTARGEKAAITTESPAKQLSGSAPSLGKQTPNGGRKGTYLSSEERGSVTCLGPFILT
ncbi:hypothetical protein NDU88_004415 [Pleurodeles waltl]|uniref:Uncharacterized protein n=1 Tax=Pleurodeles waltl TaxID=8319 RepID=A0AAV7RI73_PLEWA|nr:hypothetical protein NDU88_004415 [Pleurodeles waltl]